MGDALAIQEGRTEKTQAFQDPQFRGSWSGYERDCLFFNARGPKFYDSGHAFGIDFDDDGRAVSLVDVDGDGDLDMALLSLQGLRMLENRTPARRFARVRLEASRGDPQAIGAQVTLTAGGITQRDFVKATTGFATQTLLDLHFGLANAEKIDEIRVRWRDGSEETFTGLPVDRRIVIRQGSQPRIETIPTWTARPRLDGRIKAPADIAGVGPLVYQVGGIPPAAKSSKARIVVGAPEDPAAKALKADAPATFVFDPGGRLRRAFYRPVSYDEVEASVNHLGQGTFHADFTSVATYHLSRREFEQAERALTRAIEMNASFPIAHFYMGVLRGMQDRPGDAAAAFKRAIDLDGHYRNARHNRGVALFKAQRLQEAANELVEAINLMDSAESRHILGQVIASAGKFEEAVAQIKKAVELDPKRAEAHADLGKIYLAMGRKADAEKSLKTALELNPKLAEARDNLKKLEGR